MWRDTLAIGIAASIIMLANVCLASCSPMGDRSALIQQVRDRRRRASALNGP